MGGGKRRRKCLPRPAPIASIMDRSGYTHGRACQQRLSCGLLFFPASQPSTDQPPPPPPPEPTLISHTMCAYRQTHRLHRPSQAAALAPPRAHTQCRCHRCNGSSGAARPLRLSACPPPACLPGCGGDWRRVRAGRPPIPPFQLAARSGSGGGSGNGSGGGGGGRCGSDAWADLPTEIGERKDAAGGGGRGGGRGGALSGDVVTAPAARPPRTAPRRRCCDGRPPPPERRRRRHSAGRTAGGPDTRRGDRGGGAGVDVDATPPGGRRRHTPPRPQQTRGRVAQEWGR